MFLRAPLAHSIAVNIPTHLPLWQITISSGSYGRSCCRGGPASDFQHPRFGWRDSGERSPIFKELFDTKNMVIFLQEVEGRGDLGEGGDGIWWVLKMKDDRDVIFGWNKNTQTRWWFQMFF